MSLLLSPNPIPQSGPLGSLKLPKNTEFEGSPNCQCSLGVLVNLQLASAFSLPRGNFLLSSQSQPSQDLEVITSPHQVCTPAMYPPPACQPPSLYLIFPSVDFWEELDLCKVTWTKTTTQRWGGSWPVECLPAIIRFDTLELPNEFLN